MRTSVVIPAFEDGAALLANLPRVAALAGDKELIVADAGGNEAALARACGLGVRVVACAPSRGGQMRAGAAVATGERLLFLHADCWLDEGALASAEVELSRPGIIAVVFTQRIEGERRAYRWIEAKATRRALRSSRPYGDSGLYLRRADLERIGGYPALPLCEDLAVGRDLAKLGRFAVSSALIHLSARRWERLGVIRTTLMNSAVALAFLLGVAPAKLYRWYYGRGVPTKDGRRARADGERGEER